VQESQTLVDILNFVHPHLSRVGLAKPLARYDLKQPHEVLAIGQVGKEIVDLKVWK
jgi:hypothetical protein